ncbi:MAG: helix-turn-helix transcriptional regulator [bacterium]|nr:helix-turn-helix transcriptional regulator [bacterium]
MSRPYEMTDLAQIEALTSPIRGEIVDLVDLLGASSIAEIAAVMGRPVDSLYYHVRKLLEVGLLVETEKRKAVRQTESVYDVPGRPMHVEYKATQIDFVHALIRSISGMLRLAGRDFNAAFEKRLIRDSGQGRNVIHSRALGWFTDQEIAQIRAQIQETIAGFRSSTKCRTKGSHLYALTTILVPLEEKGISSNDEQR